MTRVALTGGIASGKSTVADALAARGAVVIDSDVLAREVVEPGTPALAAVIERFGPEIAPDGRLDRAALGRVVFADPAARRDLERIVHPAVRRRAAELERAAPQSSVVVHVIPLLVETGQEGKFDLVVVVDIDRETQLQRLQQRNGLSLAEAEARVDAQASPEARRAAADVILDNRGGLEELEQQIVSLWCDLAHRDAAK